MAQLQRPNLSPGLLPDSYGCVSCLSQSELWMALLFLMAKDQNLDLQAPGVLTSLLEDTACFTCASDTQLLRIIVSGKAELMIPDEFATEGALAEALTCLRCLKPKQIKGALTYLALQSFAPILL